MPEVTIAIPFYNAEEYLEAAISSVLSQTFEDFTLLLIDDGSTDQSLQIAQRFSNDKRVEILADGKNVNLGNRLNQIPSITKTEYLARMDADDIMHPKRIERQLQILKENPQIDVLGTNVYSIDENSDVVGLRMPLSNGLLVPVSSFFHPTIMAKTDWFRQNPYDVLALRVEDTELWMRTKNKSNFTCLTEPLLFYREVGNKYYKKYFKGLPGVLYMLKKNKYSKDHLTFFIRYFISCFLYLFFNILGLEHILIQKRNKVDVPKMNYTKYI